MSHSENTNWQPGQPADDKGEAGRQPFEGQPPRRPTRPEAGASDQGTARPFYEGGYGEQARDMGSFGAPGRAQPVEGGLFTPYTNYGEQDALSPEQPQAEIYRRDVPPSAPPEPPFTSTAAHYPASERPAGAARSQPAEREGRPAAYAAGAGLQTGVPVVKKGRANLLVGLLTGGLLCLLLGGLAGWQIGRHNAISQRIGGTSYKSGAMTPEEVIAQDRQAVVQINVKMAKGAGVGSGVIIDSQGHIITNEHVVTGGEAYSVVLFDGSSLPAKLVGVDPADDLAVVKINPPGKMYVMSIGDSSKLEVGNTVLAIGNPLGITQTVTQGIVSALGRTVNEGRGGGTIVDAVQTDAPINPGNSGGALVSLNGNLIGIPTLVAIDPEFKTPANGVGFAVPSNRVKFIAPQLIQYGKVVHSGRAALQASVTTVDDQLAAQAGLSINHGVLIVSTVSGGAAARAGLRTGDVITQINTQIINNVSDLSDALLAYDPGATVTVSYVRGTQQNQAKVRLSERKIS
ncbi:MAG TPA: trypsin-like peptidase domain-containing protein [Ktedonobacteraceae bacterium]|nr:trypsin-like peptidase domain-containing protein [Ktedonobacteraceae bacterium]